MIRYRLLEPMRQRQPEHGARREALVSMNAQYCDERRAYHVDGDPALVAEIAEAIPRAGGFEGSTIEGGITTPRDLSYCFSKPIMRRYEAQIIEGEDVLARREPPSEFTLHSILAGFLGASLPQNAAADGTGTEEALEELGFQWPHWRCQHPAPEDAAAALAAMLMPEIRSAFQFPRSLRLSLEEPGRPPPLFSADISDEQALMLTRVLTDLLDRYLARELSSQQLLDTMRARVEALGLPPAR